MNNKILIITTALKQQVVAAAERLNNTTTENTIIADGALVEGVKIHHTHAEYGEQTVLIDRVLDNAWVVSFAGSQEYLDLINSNGWLSSAETLQTYLMDLNPEMEEFLSKVAVVAYNDQVLFAGVIGDDTQLDMEFIAGVVQASNFVGSDTVEVTKEFLHQLGEEIGRVVEPVITEVDQSTIRTEVDAEADVIADTILHDAEVPPENPNPSTDEPDSPTPERKFRMFKNLSPKAKFVIGETARVCACVAGTIVVSSAIVKVASVLFDKAEPSQFEM